MDMVKITGLWKNTDKNGNSYLSGSLSPITNLLIMPNSFKKDAGDKAPDFYLYLAPKEKQSSNGSNFL